MQKCFPRVFPRIPNNRKVLECGFSATRAGTQNTVFPIDFEHSGVAGMGVVFKYLCRGRSVKRKALACYMES